MRLNELKFASLSFSAENARRLGSYIYKSAAIVTRNIRVKRFITCNYRRVA